MYAYNTYGSKLELYMTGKCEVAKLNCSLLWHASVFAMKTLLFSNHDSGY